MLPVNPSAAFDPSPSAVGQKSWNGSAAFEINLSGIASAAFYLEIDATNLHDLPEPSRNDMDVSAAPTFALWRGVDVVLWWWRKGLHCKDSYILYALVGVPLENKARFAQRVRRWLGGIRGQTNLASRLC